MPCCPARSKTWFRRRPKPSQPTQDGPDRDAPTDRGPRAPSVAPPGHPPHASRWPQRTQLVWAIVPLLVVAVVLGVYWMGKSPAVPGISGTPTNAATTAAAVPPQSPVDQAKVAALMKKISANPKDIASLQGSATSTSPPPTTRTHRRGSRRSSAVDPKNQVALLALGAAQFNLGNAAEAKKQWLVAAGLYPKNAEVHYDLGFLYMSATPPDKANMTAEWKKVIAIDPNSALAKTVATHIKGASYTHRQVTP